MENESGATYIPRRSRELFFFIEGSLRDLAHAISRVEERLAHLSERYKKELGGTQLILVARDAEDSPHPQNLYWAVLLPPKLVEGGTGTGERIWRRIRGELTDRHIARYAGDYRNKARYYEFDAERQALNEAHAKLANTRGRILKILGARFHTRGSPFAVISPRGIRSRIRTPRPSKKPMRWATRISRCRSPG